MSRSLEIKVFRVDNKHTILCIVIMNVKNEEENTYNGCVFLLIYYIVHMNLKILCVLSMQYTQLTTKF